MGYGALYWVQSLFMDGVIFILQQWGHSYFGFRGQRKLFSWGQFLVDFPVDRLLDSNTDWTIGQAMAVEELLCAKEG